MSKVKVETQSSFAPTPTVYLTENVGSKLTGRLHKRVESQTYPGKLSYLVAVTDTDAPIRLYDKDTKKNNDVDIEAGALVWLKGTTVLSSALEKIEDGSGIEIVYLGKGTAKKGRQAPYLFDVFKVGA